MIDRGHVIEIIEEGLRNSGDPLEALESEGYRVVRAGMVPHLDALDEAEQMLTRLWHISGAIHSPQEAGEAATQIRQLRELALMVLGIDRTDVDELDPQGGAR